VRVEDSPSPVYGAALLMRLGLTPFRGSNPRSSAGGQAGEQALCPAGEVPACVSVSISTPCWHECWHTPEWTWPCGGRARRGGGGRLGQFLATEVYTSLVNATVLCPQDFRDDLGRPNIVAEP
jgi:hypothetical protein